MQLNRTRVKICGLTRLRDLRDAVAAGADAVGFVFAESKRRLGADAARRLSLEVPPGVMRVALFQNQDEQTVRKVLAEVPVDMLQFHGTESNAFCASFERPFLKAVSMAGGDAGAEIGAYPDAAGLLLDSHRPGGAGGTGRSFDWSNIPACPHPLWLAGGLNAANVALAIREVRPWAVDVSSGVEEAPGIKSREKILEFMRAVASAAQDSPQENGVT